MKILIVDDELVSRKKMEKIMQRFGSCRCAESGMDAIKAFTEALIGQEPFNLVTLDVSMPDMGGTETLAMIRSIERKNAIPKDARAKILMVTSHSDPATVMNSIEAGCDDYLKKPFSFKHVTRKLDRMGVDTSLPGTVNRSEE